jgi:osmotically-inducible protein OsmY
VRRINGESAASLLAVALVLTAPLGGCASTKCTTPACEADARITANVQALLAQHRDLGPPNQIHVDTRNGVVYLSGQVATDLQRSSAESVARQAADVNEIINNIALMYTGF